MPRFGNAGSISSLLSSAQAARKRQESLQDSIASYEWDLSAKTQEDYAKYVQHLGERAKTYGESDPMRALEYQKKITSAQRGFTSAEIGRATTQVLYGNSSNRDKYNTIAQLYQSAIANGDESLAQRLESQAARLSVTIQNEADAAAGRYRSGVKSGYDAKIKETERDLRTIEQSLKSGKADIVTYMAAKDAVLKAKAQVLDQASNDTSLEDSARINYQNKATDFANDDKLQTHNYQMKQLMNAGDKNGQIDTSKLPFRVEVNDKTGDFELKDRKIAGQTGKTYGGLTNIFDPTQVNIPNIASGKDLTGTIDVNRKLSTDVNSGIAPFGMKAYSSTNNPALQDAQNKLGNFAYYVDPVTGQEIVVAEDGTRTRLKDALETKDFKDKVNAEYDKQYYDTLGNSARNLGASILRTAGGPLSTIIQNYGTWKQADDTRKAAEALRAKQEAAKAAEAERARIAAAAAQVKLPPAANFSYNTGQGVKVNAPFDAMNAASQIAKQSGSAAPVVQTFLNQNPFGAANIYGKKL